LCAAERSDPRTTLIKPGIGAKCGNSFNTAKAAEVAWTFSGGGFSRVFSRPSYEETLPVGTVATIPPSSRGVPDIAFQASSATGALVYLSLPPDGNGSNINHTGWYDTTRASSGLGLINPALYKLAANPATYSADFFDIGHTTGVGVQNNNQGDPSVPGYPADTGWDAVTGLRHAERRKPRSRPRHGSAQLAGTRPDRVEGAEKRPRRR
jgi:hypothetical protein